MRCLLVDIMFPNKYAKWRNAEIKNFVEKYDTDILIINKTNECDGNKFDFDYDELKCIFDLHLYDILIFNANMNNLNKFNINFDGCKFNNKLPCSYMFRLKKYRDDNDLLIDYSFVYHIFLMCYSQYQQLKKNNTPNFVHLYPGGGWVQNQQFIEI